MKTQKILTTAAVSAVPSPGALRAAALLFAGGFYLENDVARVIESETRAGELLDALARVLAEFDLDPGESRTLDSARAVVAKAETARFVAADHAREIQAQRRGRLVSLRPA